MVEQPDILSKLADLHKQATTERSHYYVASVVRESMVEITRSRATLRTARDLIRSERAVAMAERKALHARMDEGVLNGPAVRNNREAIERYDAVLAKIEEVLK
jgi:hypothetical protein